MAPITQCYRSGPLGGAAHDAAKSAREAFIKTAADDKGREVMATKSAIEKLRCPKCKKDGSAKWQEPAEQRKRKLIGLSAGFKSIDKGGHEGQLIVCADCGSKITSG
jgi:hypothetical protein